VTRPRHPEHRMRSRCTASLLGLRRAPQPSCGRPKSRPSCRSPPRPSPAGPNRAGCPTSAPWAAIAAIPPAQRTTGNADARLRALQAPPNKAGGHPDGSHLHIRPARHLTTHPATGVPSGHAYPTLRWQHRDVPGPGRSKRPRPSWKPPTATSYGRLAPTGQPRTITQPRLRRGPA
jgi:hypothetical protein